MLGGKNICILWSNVRQEMGLRLKAHNLCDGECGSFTEIRQGRAMTVSKVGWKYLPLHSIVLGAINKKMLDCYRDLAIMAK